MTKSTQLEEFAEQFARKKGLIHLNNAGLSPISNPAKEKIQMWGQRFYEEGFWTDADYMQDVKQSRSNIAKLIGCDWDDIAFFPNTSFGISQFAFGINLAPGDEVLIWDQEYSSHLYPWQEACRRSGARLHIVESNKDLSLDTERFIQSINEKTKVVAFSWVQFMTGAMMDYISVIAACKKNGILVFVDVMQGLGLLECDLWSLGVDGISGGSHKWLASPVGAGFLAIRKELANKIKPLSYGAYTYGTCDDPSDLSCSPKRDATRFESGSKQVLEITALGASCELILRVTPTKIRDQAIALATYLDQGLKKIGCLTHNPNGLAYQHPIVNFTPPPHQSKESLCTELKKHNINFAIRGPGIRFSPQAFNTFNELDLVLEIIQENSRMR